LKNNKMRRTYSQISRRLFSRYVISLLLLLVIPVGGFFLAWMFCAGVVWHEKDVLYQFLKMLQALSPYIILIILTVGFFVITAITIRKPLRYLDDVIDAAKSLAHPGKDPITLPEEMFDVENEINLAREQALDNIRLLKEAEQRKNDLIMYLAHDLKTPLASVIGYLDLLRDTGELPEELRSKYLSIALGKAQRLEDLINDFFEIARFNLSHITLQYSSINLTRLLEQLVYEFKPMLQEKNLSCELHMEENVMYRCDAGQIQRVFDNLLRNAVIYSYEGTVIDIRAESQETSLVIRFSNQGDTIPEEKLNRIFEQFYRVDHARSTNSGGAGLGLAIAREIVELHGGTIQVESRDERTWFTVTLPILQSGGAYKE
jgi:Osmosensitive K+ channel histidine kinase